jgi:hypothetical protein
MQIEVSKVYIPCRLYRGEVEMQFDACFSIEEAKKTLMEKAGEMFTDCTPERMKEIIDEGPKECVYSFSQRDDELLFYPDGNGNWPVEIRTVKLKQKVIINV